MAVDLPTKDEKRRLCLSYKTIEGIILTNMRAGNSLRLNVKDGENCFFSSLMS